MERNKLGQFVIGHAPTYKPDGRSRRGKTNSKEHNLAISRANKGRKFSEAHKQKLRLAKLGKTQSTEHRLKISLSKRGEKCHLWRGGLTEENTGVRNGIDFRLWREAVFRRDKWTCKNCKIEGYRLEAHHILNFATSKDDRFLVKNGITFCQRCHRRFHELYGRKDNNRKQLLEFLTKQI